MKNLVLLLAFAIMGFMVTVNAVAKTVVTDGLVSYWTFDRGTIKDGKVVDVWGENDAAIVGNPKRVDGYVREGLELDGNGEYVSLPNVGNFGSQIGKYTFEAWIKTKQKDRWSAIYRVLEKSCARSNNGADILINSGGGRGFRGDIVTEQDSIMIERSRIRGNGCSSSRSGIKFPISDGEWHQIVYTARRTTEDDVEEFKQFGGDQLARDGCYRNVGYIDGNVIMDSFSCSFPADFTAYVEPIFLGAVNNRGKASGFFEGVFDEVRIYDRALTPEEVIRNYESGIGLGVEAEQKLPTVWGALKERR